MAVFELGFFGFGSLTGPVVLVGLACLAVACRQYEWSRGFAFSLWVFVFVAARYKERRHVQDDGVVEVAAEPAVSPG